MKSRILILTLVIALAQSAVAQSSGESNFPGFRRGLATVMLASLGGAVLGLSTLSFYGNPEDHIGNIWTGLAIGGAAGTAWVFSQSAERAFYAEHEFSRPRDVSRVARSRPLLVQFAWDF